MKPCIYRGQQTQRVVGMNQSPIYDCIQLKECTEFPTSNLVATCKDCHYQLDPDDPEFSKKWLDPLHVIDRTRTPNHCLRNLLAGGAAFLVCGGPSATVDLLEELSHRGHFSMAVNNKAGHSKFRPQAFVYSDDSFKFSHSIWYDPAIMKFCPTPKLNGHRANLKYRDPVTHKFLDGGKVLDCPNVWAFGRRSWLELNETFFTEPSAAWGNHKVGVERTGLEKVVCTMLIAIRLLYYLGARKIFLVGADFNMIPGEEYSFPQGKETEGAADSNNYQYSVVNRWLTELQDNGTFSRFGLNIYNCNNSCASGLTAFPFVDFSDAIRISQGRVESNPDLRHWYEKIEEDFMERIEEFVVQGLSVEEIVEKVNESIDNRDKHVSVDKVNKYLRVLIERQD